MQTSESSLLLSGWGRGVEIRKGPRGGGDTGQSRASCGQALHWALDSRAEQDRSIPAP